MAGDDSHPNLLQHFGTLQFEANSSSKAGVQGGTLQGGTSVWGHCWALSVCHSLNAAERLLEQMVLRGSFVCCHSWNLCTEGSEQDRVVLVVPGWGRTD